MIKQSTMKKEQSFLDEDANNISILKKQICKQSEIDASVQTTINEKIEILKQNATVLANKLQNQKHKNVQLQMIINHIRNKMEKEKLQEASYRENSAFQGTTVLENKYKKFQYDLGQFNGKANRISENVEEKRNKIKQIRTQRVIDSGIFRNIEKELIESQLKFKKLLIQKIKYEKQYEKLLNDYRSLKEKAENLNENSSNKSKNNDQENTFMLELAAEKEKHAKKFTNLQIHKDNAHYKVRTMTNLQSQMEYEQQQKGIKIHKILNQLGLQNTEQLMNNYFHIQEINQKCFNEINSYNDQISQIEKYIVMAQEIKNNQKNFFEQGERQLTKNQMMFLENKRVTQNIQEVQRERNNQIQEIKSFFKKENFQELLKRIDAEEKLENYDETNFEDLTELLKVIQTKMQNYLVEPCIQITKRSGKSTNKSHQKLEQIINQMKKPDQCLKIMKKEEFQDEYNRIMKSNLTKKASSKTIPKRKSNQFIKP